MEKIAANIKLYVHAWTQQTPETIKAALESSCAADIRYIDRQTGEFSGISRLVELILHSYTVVPGRIITIESEPEFFGGHAHYNWGIQVPGGPVRIGHDYLIYNEAQKIVSIVGFLPLP